MAQELLNIKIETLPNGYALTVVNNEYMYFTLENLTQGFLYHVCLGELGAASNEDIKTILDAAVAYRADNGETAKKMTEIVSENERLTTSCENLKKNIERKKGFIKRLKDELKNAKVKVDVPDDDEEEDEDE